MNYHYQNMMLLEHKEKHFKSTECTLVLSSDIAHIVLVNQVNTLNTVDPGHFLVFASRAVPRIQLIQIYSITKIEIYALKIELTF